MKLRGKTALVTGGATGLGFSIATSLLKQGMNVAICSRSKKSLKKAESHFQSKKLSTFECDVTDYNQLTSIVKKIGIIDVLINNAGIWVNGQIDSIPAAKITTLIDTNVKGVILSTKAVLPQMKKAGGFIINIVSTTGLAGRANESLYSASKFAVRGFTESLKLDMKSSEVKVAGIYPGGMNTKMFEKGGKNIDNKSWMKPKKIAEVVTFILENDQAMTIDRVVINRANN